MAEYAYQNGGWSLWDGDKKAAAEKAVILVCLIRDFAEKISVKTAAETFGLSVEEFRRRKAQYPSALNLLREHQRCGTLTGAEKRELELCKIAERATGISFDADGNAQCGFIQFPQELRERETVSMYDIRDYVLWTAAFNTVDELIKKTAAESAKRELVISMAASGELSLECAATTLGISTAEAAQLVLQYPPDEA